MTSHEVIVELIAATSTCTGLKVRAECDPGEYPKGTKISDRELDLRDPVQAGDPGWHGSHLLPPAALRAGPDAVRPAAVR